MSAEEFNINEAVAHFATQNLNVFVESGAGLFKVAADKARLKLTSTYSVYLKSVCEKHSRVKSFFFRAEPTYLYNFYVPTALRYSRGVIGSPNVKTLSEISKRIVVVGSAGSGKSMLMRHLLLNSIEGKQQVPIFVELRQFSDEEFDLMGLLFAALKENRFQLDREYIEKALREGHFSVFLDGLDEVSHSKRVQATKQIQDFAKRYEKINLFISSRQDNELEGWSDFLVMKMEPLSLELAEKLIEKIDYDPELKAKFAKELRVVLFEKHQSLLSNPLLLTIMLLTYGQSANIPDKLNVFYNQAYEALFERHDTLKSGYRRNHYTPLDIQDFAKVFSAFSLVSYDKRKFMFSQIEALGFIEKAKGIVAIECDKNNYLKDAQRSVCLLAEDGLNLVFTHRSFQEYFVARFILEAPPKIQKQLISKYAEYMRMDSVFVLLHEMRPELIEQEFLRPELRKMFRALGINRKVTPKAHLKYLQICFDSIEIAAAHLSLYITSRNRSRFSDLTSFAIKTCGKLVPVADEKPFRDIVKNLGKKYAKSEKSVRIKLNNLTVTSELYKDISECGGFMSIKLLQRVFDIQAALISKTRSKCASLEDILGN